ncbi:MAG: hypothetical protein HN348_22600, partial [Proteobacteria bacterium]|nr:hypothetical protein [Pseudomonadota bacterium]
MKRSPLPLFAILLFSGCTVVFVDDTASFDTDTNGKLDSDEDEDKDTGGVSWVIQPDTLTVGGKHYCVIEANQSVSCFGNNAFGQSAPSSGAFTQISAGMNHTCGVDTNGAAICWGSNEYGQTAPPNDNFLLVAAGGKHSCGITTSNTLTCWGSEDGNVADGVVEVAHLSVGERQNCVITKDGDWRCWERGSNGVEELVKKEGDFIKVAAGPDFSCVMDSAGHSYCDGINYSFAETDVLSDIRAGNGFLCVLDLQGQAYCREGTAIGMDAPQTTFAAIDVSDYG